MAEPGTTIVVVAGDYPGPLELRRGGAEGAYVIFTAADPDAMPRILGDASADSAVYIDASYVVFQYFEVANHRRAALSEDAIGIQLEDNELFDDPALADADLEVCK